MAANFPSNPSVGDIFSVGSVTYSYDGRGWKVNGSVGRVTVSTTPPTTAAYGDKWLDSANAIEYTWYYDGDTTQWVELGTFPSGLTTANVVESNNLYFTNARAQAALTGQPLSVSTISTTGNVRIGGNFELEQIVVEKANVSATALVANITFNVTDQSVTYFTTNASANSTINFTGVSGIGTGNVVSAVVVVTNGASGKYISTVQVEGSAPAAIYWAGGAPTSGSANIDVYAFNIIKTGASTYNVLASVTDHYR